MAQPSPFFRDDFQLKEKNFAVPELSKEPHMTEEQISKRELLKKAAYIAPAILTLKAVSSFASSGSCQAELERRNDKRKGNNGVGNGFDPQPPGNPRVNDGPGTGPGNPGNKRRNNRR